MTAQTSPDSINTSINTIVASYHARIRERIVACMTSLPDPAELYDPFRYAMEQPGKYMRPLMTMLGSALHGEASEESLHAGVAVEIMHTFTLVHDDIMDKSPLRRGQPTVHSRWDESTAILSGDVMMGVAYKMLLEHIEAAHVPEVLRLFTAGFIEVCEGQALDVAFASRPHISMAEYLLMIEKKTARLPETAACIGACLAGAKPDEMSAIRTYAREAGIAFQIQDDLLDLQADQAELGKKVGQDILEGKRTYLIVRSQEKATTPEHRALLERFVSEQGLPESEVSAMRSMMSDLGVFDDAQDAIERGFQRAEAALDTLPQSIARDGFFLLNDQLRGRRK